MSLDSTHTTRTTGSINERASAVVAALSVYVEPLVADARIAVVGDGELGLHARFLELGARTIHLYDPDPQRVARTADEVPRGVSVRMLRDEFDVRDGAFDLVIIPDVGLLPDPSGAIVRLRRVVDPRGSVVAMGRARTPSGDNTIFPELAPAVVEYAELYDLFALQFESVTMTGVLPFDGVVFAELGAGDDLAVSVDTRLVEPAAPGVFVVIAGREAASLDPYAIVQISRDLASESPATEVSEETGEHLAEAEEAEEEEDDFESVDTIAVAALAGPAPVREESRDHEAAAAFAAMQLKAELLTAQLDEHRSRLLAVESSRDARGAEQAARFDRLALERDVALTRATELEGILVDAQQALAILERRLLEAERGMLERDDQIAALNAELDARVSNGQELATAAIDPAIVADILTRAERAETSLALHVADLAHVTEAHASETAGLEAQLRDRARVINAMDKELARREHLVRELVASLEEVRENAAAAVPFQAAPATVGVAPEEVVRLRRKLDDLALEVARREGELVAQAWRISELENDKARLLASPVTPPAPAAPPSRSGGGAGEGRGSDGDVGRLRDEIDALRQALTQEHAARVAAESGEELARARAELARQSALLEQMRGRSTQPEG